MLDNYKLLFDSIEECETKLIKKYITSLNINGINCKEERYNNTSPLVFAIENNCFEAVDILLNLGADPNYSKFFGKDYGIGYPIHLSIVNEATRFYDGFSLELETKITEKLLEYNADFNQRNFQGKTPIDIAIEYRHNTAIDILRKYGAKTSKELEGEKN